MIIFQTNDIRIDLSGYGVSLNEENPLFSDNIYKSYSLPFTIRTDDELWERLGMPGFDNITGVQTKIPGKLLLPDRYYNAFLFLGEIVGEAVECDLSFGDEELAVYDLDLQDLPWPIVLTPNLLQYANEVKNKKWPETGFNFPMVYNPSISEKTNYESFRGFVNNHTGSQYMTNISFEDHEGMKYHNYNVMAPMPYLLEILRFGFSIEGKSISGPAVNNEVLQKAIYIPENYLEKFRGSEFQSFSFSLPGETIMGSPSYGIHQRQFTLEKTGTYHLKFDLNLDPLTASEFELRVDQMDPSGPVTNLYQARSKNNRVKIEEELQINIDQPEQYDELIITLKVTSVEDLSGKNQFEFSFKDGQLNEHPSYFSLRDFVPDMTFGEYVNLLKNWFNLDIEISDNEARISYGQESILRKPRQDHRHLEIANPTKQHNSNRFYKLSYANGDRVFYNKNGQIFSDLDEEGDDVIEIELDVQPAIVEQNEGIITAVMPEDRAGIDFAVYDGTTGGRPLFNPKLIRELSLQKVFERDWEQWLYFRVHSKTFKDTVECSVFESISIRELSMKYNELHVIKKLTRKYLSETMMRVDVESETF